MILKWIHMSSENWMKLFDCKYLNLFLLVFFLLKYYKIKLLFWVWHYILDQGVTLRSNNKNNSMAGPCESRHICRVFAARAFFYNNNITKCVTFKTKVKEYNIHIGAIRWRISTSVKFIRQFFLRYLSPFPR